MFPGVGRGEEGEARPWECLRAVGPGTFFIFQPMVDQHVQYHDIYIYLYHVMVMVINGYAWGIPLYWSSFWFDHGMYF